MSLSDCPAPAPANCVANINIANSGGSVNATSNCTALSQSDCNTIVNQNRGLVTPAPPASPAPVHTVTVTPKPVPVVHAASWLSPDWWHWALLAFGAAALLAAAVTAAVLTIRYEKTRGVWHE